MKTEHRGGLQWARSTWGEPKSSVNVTENHCAGQLEIGIFFIDGEFLLTRTTAFTRAGLLAKVK